MDKIGELFELPHETLVEPVLGASSASSEVIVFSILSSVILVSHVLLIFCSQQQIIRMA